VFASEIAPVCRAFSFPFRSFLINDVASSAYVYSRMPFYYVDSNFYDNVSPYSFDLHQQCIPSDGVASKPHYINKDVVLFRTDFTVFVRAANSLSRPIERGYMMRKQYKILAIIFSLLLINGCAVNRATSQIMPGTELDALNKFYVVKFIPDGRGINKLISNRLNEMGHPATTGPESMAPEDIDVIVTYKDKWMWDITMYMIELTITFREPDTDYPLAEGNSYHTSLTRLSTEEMVDEILTNIFSGNTGTQ
jgi:hypothetical protein